MQIQAALFSFRFCVRFEISSNNVSIISVSSWPGHGDVSKTRKGRNSFHEKFLLSVFCRTNGSRCRHLTGRQQVIHFKRFKVPRIEKLRFSILGYETWFLIGQAREVNQHEDWDWNDKESHKVIRLLMEEGMYEFKLLDIIPLYRTPGFFFWISATVYFLRNCLVWYHIF